MEYYPRTDERTRKPLFSNVAAKYKMSYDIFKPLLVLIEKCYQDKTETDAL